MSSTVEEIKERLSIVDVVASYVELKKAGISYKARCPFHSERTPSFTVSPERGTYHCFGCGVGGDMFSFVEAIEGLDFKGALKILAERAGVEIKYDGGDAGEKDERDRLYKLLETATLYFERELSQNGKAYAYVESRGITPATIKSFRIGWAPDEWRALSGHLKSKGFTESEMIASGVVAKSDKGIYDRFRSRVMFPIADTAGRIVAFSGRIFSESAKDSDAPKYINSPETLLYHKGKILYGFDRAKLSIRKHDCSLLVEGQMDLVMSHQAGWTNTVAVSGTALTPEHVALLHRLSQNLLLALDADEAGIAAAEKSARAALVAGMDVKVVSMPSGKDPADVIKAGGSDAWKQAIKTAKHVVIFLLDVLEKASKDPRAYLKVVEEKVIPFIADMKSPLERELFAREVASRTGSSESSVLSAIAKQIQSNNLKLPPTLRPTPAPVVTRGTVADMRARQAFGLLLWQQSLTTQSIDVTAYEARVREAIGPEQLAALLLLPPPELEKIRFEVERIYKESKEATIKKESEALLASLDRERLQKELALETLRLKRAEHAHDASEIAAALDACQRITGAIAKLSVVL